MHVTEEETHKVLGFDLWGCGRRRVSVKGPFTRSGAATVLRETVCWGELERGFSSTFGEPPPGIFTKMLK